MSKLITPEEKIIRDSKREAKKIEAAKIKQFKHNMEIVRTLCAIVAVVLNLFVLTHVLGFW